jgi:SAM-dependent methyltransferase
MRAGSRFLDATPASVELIRRCTGEINPGPDHQQWYDKYAKAHTARLALDLDIVGALIAPGSAILEVGAIPLVLTCALVDRGYAVTGVDVHPDRFAAAVTALQVQVAACDVETDPLPFPDGAFDCVLFNEVLEHLRINPIHALREVRRVLRPGGTLLLSTPNLRSLNGVWNLLVHGRSYALADNIYDEFMTLERLGHMGHIREYAPGDVKVLLAKIGFRVDELIYRQRQRDRFAEAICRAQPGLRRFVSYVARVEG